MLKSKLNKKYSKNSFLFDITAALAAGIFIISGLLVSLHRYWQYEVFYYNFGVFDQAIWRVSRLKPPVIEHLLVGGRISLADHFDLSILLLAPVFWITDKSESLLFIQAIFAGLAGFIIYKIGTEVLKDKFKALGLSLCYFFFVGIQNAVITDFHELTIMSLPITLVFLSIIKKRLKSFWLFFLLTLGFKEVTFLLGCGIAIFIWFLNKQWRLHAIAATVVSILWGYLTINILIPYFSDGVYLHRPDLPDSLFGKVTALFDHPSKRETVFYSLLNFGFLPIFAPGMWFVILQDYILRFIPLHVLTRWTLGLHYNAQVAPLLAIASIFGFKFLHKIPIVKRFSRLFILLLVLNSFIQFRFVHHGPFLMAINPALYNHTKNFAYLDNLITKIPKDASIMTQNNIGVRFTHQEFIYLRQNYEPFAPDYILLDNRPGQNPNNFLFAPEIPGLIAKIQMDKDYVTIYQKGDQYIFKRRQ